jgi:hypothetical protein
MIKGGEVYHFAKVARVRVLRSYLLKRWQELRDRGVLKFDPFLTNFA